MNKVKITSYTKNVAKSFGYAIGDVFGTYNPTLKKMIKDTKETTESIYQGIKDFKADTLPTATTAGKGIINQVFDNLKEDLKTGNWYNKQRKDAADLELAKAVGFDFDFEDDFGLDDDWGDDNFGKFDEEEGDISDASMVAASNEKNAKQIVNAMDIVGYKVSGAVSEATIESANYVVQSNTSNTKALYDLNQKGFNNITEALMSVNNSIVSFAKIGEPLTSHMQNASVFYTKTTETLNRIDQSIQQLVKNTTPVPLATSKEAKLNKNGLSEILDDGAIDIGSYINLINENLSGYKDMLKFITGGDDGEGGKKGGLGGMLKNFSPMQQVTKLIVSNLLPQVFKESMTMFNDTLKYSLSGGLVKLRNKNSGNLLLEILKDTFLPKDGFKKSLNLSNYEKGAVAWDGVSRKALIEVIPTALFKIYSAISGRPEMRYDYENGKFISVANIKKEADEEFARAAQDAGGDFRRDALNYVRERNFSEEQKKKLEKEIESYFLKSFSTGEDFFDLFKSDFNINKFGISENSLKILRNLVNKYSKSRDREERNRANEFITSVALARDEYGDRMRRNEATGMDNRVHLQNNGYDGEASKFATDEYNHSSMFYLQGIYQYTGYLADNIGYISGKSKNVKRRGKLKRGGKVQDISSVPTSRTNNITETNTVQDDATARSIIDNLELDEDERARKEKEEREKEIKDGVSNVKKNVKERLRSLFKTGPNSAYSKPFNAVANLLDAIGFSLDKLIWGKEGSSQPGIFDFIMNKTKEAFSKLDKFIEDKFNFKLSDKLKNFWKSLLGKEGKLNELKNETTDELKNAGKWLGNTAKQTLFGYTADNGTAAHGRKVTKTGIVAVSEGELIVPSELNPYYHGITNKAAQVRNEQRVVDNFYGSFAPGGRIPYEGEYDRRKHGKKVEYFQYREGKWVHLTESKDIEDAKKHFKKLSDKKREQAKIKQSVKNGGGIVGKIYQGLYSADNSVYNTGKNFVTGLWNSRKGEEESEDEKKDSSVIKEIAKKTLSEAGDKKGAVAAGALIGGGVSLLTGAVVGPLFGAAIGGAVGLTIKSKTVQKLLFGETDEDGNLDGGILGKNISNFIVKNVPNMAKGGALGGIAGIFMGSPILGAILGSTVGYINSSEKAKTFLFGELDENGNRKGSDLFSAEFQKRVKSSTTKIAAGAILGAAIGPFGLMGNIMLGAGLGYLSETKKFHEYLFGKEDDDRDKGLAGIFKEKIFNNLDSIFHNLGNAISGWGKNLIRSTSERLKDFFTKRARAFENGEQQNLLDKIIGGVASVPGRALKAGTNFVGNRLTRINSKLIGKNLKNGYNVYDRELGRNMLASERVEARGGYLSAASNKGFGKFDKLLANGSREELEQLRDQLQSAKDPNRVYKRSMNSAMGELYSGLRDLDANKAEKIAKYIQNGDIGKISKILTPEELEKYSDVINSASRKVATAKNSKNNSKAILNKFAQQGMKFGTGDINTALDRLNDELKNNPMLSEEEKEKKEQKDWRQRVLRVFESIDENIARKFGFKNSEGKEPKEENNNTRRGIGRALERLSVEETPEEFTQIDAFGNVHKYALNGDGDPEEVRNDSATDQSRRKMDEFMESVTSIPVIGSAISGLTGMFGFFKDKLLGSEDGQKEGLFSKLLGFLSGENGGPLQWLTNIISGTKIGRIASSMLSGISLKGILNNIVGPALLVEAFKGSFDELAKKITNGGYGDGSKDDIITDKNTGKEIHQDEDGNWVDNNGETVENPSISVRKGSPSSFSDKLKYNTARGLLTNTSSLASKTLGKTFVAKQMKSFGSAAMDVVKNGGGDDIAAMATRMNFGSMITDACKKFTKALAKVPALQGVADKLDDMGLALANKATQALASESAEKLAKFAANAVAWAKIAFVVIDFTSGFEDARTTLGIVDEPSFGQKVLSGLLRAVKNFIPIIGSLIPDSTIIDVFCDYLAPALGIDVEELKAKRQKAQETVSKYNEANGTDYSVGEFNKSVLKDYTWTERIGNVSKSTWADTKQKFSNMKKGIKEKGLLRYQLDQFKEMGATFINSYKENGGGLSGLFKGMGDSFSKMLPGIFGEIAKKNGEIRSLASKGELGKMWSVSLDDFSGGGDKIEGTDLETATPGFFSKLVGQLPLYQLKIVMTPMALIKMLWDKEREVFSNLIDKTKNSFSHLIDGSAEADVKAKNGDLKGLWDIDINDSDPENPVGGITKGIFFTKKIMNSPTAMVFWVGKKIKEGFMNIVGKVKNSFTHLIDGSAEADVKTKEGDLKGLWDIDINDSDSENPVGGITKGIFFIKKIINSPTAMVHWVGNKVKDGVTGLIEKSKENYDIATKSVDALKKLSNEGKVSDIWKSKLKLNKLDTLGPIWHIIFTFNKMINVIFGAINWIGNKVKDSLKVPGWLEDIIDFVSGAGSKVNKMGDNASVYANLTDEQKTTAKNRLRNLRSSGAGSGTNFVSQLDDKYRNIRLGKYTVGQKGCAPAVATMVANNYGKNLSMNSAVSSASKYQNEAGTRIDYFDKVLNSQGIGTERLAGKDVPQKVIQNLANGQSVILLGRDPKNTSKEYSPFGPGNHYVVATGLDSKGNIIVNDPELNAPRAYNSSILNNTKFGISTELGGGSNYDTETARKVWSFFTSRGYSPAATAGILGNMYQESGVNPTSIQGGGKGPAAGIVQWENYTNKSARWNNMNQYAISRGYHWTELTPQLEFVDFELNNGMDYWFNRNTKYQNLAQFKAETDPKAATLGFEKAFERAGKPNMESRYNATDAYYKLYNNSKYTGNWVAEAHNPLAASIGSVESGLNLMTGTNNNSNGFYSNNVSAIATSDNNNSGPQGILDVISSAFSNVLGTMLGGKKVGTTQTASTDTLSLGVNMLNRVTGKGNDAQRSIVNKAISILGKNTYTKDTTLRNKVDQGYSDCSSFARWVYQQSLGIDPGSNTGVQIQSPLFVPVDQGARPNVNNLEPGDLMFYENNTNNGRPYNVGHVEIYDGEGNTIGHGGGIGPKRQPLENYVNWMEKDGRPYIMSMRYRDIAKASGGSSGLVMNSRAGSYVYSGSGSGLTIPSYSNKHFRSFSGGASNITTQTTDMLNNLKNTIVQQGNSGSISTDLVVKLVKAIIDILEKIANNTAPVGKIYQELSSKSSNGSNNSTVIVNNGSSKNDFEIDSNIKSLVGTLAELAKG